MTTCCIRLFFLLFPAFLAVAQVRETPVAWSLANLSPQGENSPGDRLTLTLTARIEPGWHLYATTQPISNGPRPTRIVLTDGQPFKLIGLVEPQPKLEFDNNFKADTAWHAGTVTFRLSVAVADNVRLGLQQLMLQTTYQACTPEKCLAPRTDTHSIAIRIVPAETVMPSASERKDEEAAFRAAASIRDPAKRMPALEKFAAEYPRGSLATVANRNLLELLIQARPSQPDMILSQAKRLIDGAQTGAVRGSWLNTVATMLLNEGILLEAAAGFAEESVASLPNRQSLGDPQRLRDAYGRTLLISQVPRVATLGRLNLRLNRKAEGEKLVREAFGADPKNPAALLGMGDLAALNGQDELALDYYASAHLTGMGGKVARRNLELFYGKLHSNNPGAMEEWLDAKYRRENPPLMRGARREAASNGRVVLAEVFTGAMCAPCLGADLAFEALVDEYKTSSLSLLMYHVHIPTRDPLTNPATDARKTYYSANTAPYALLDGRLIVGIGSNREQAPKSYAKLREAIEVARGVAPTAQIKAGALQEGTSIKITGEAFPDNSSGERLRLQIALVEDEVRYSGSNGLRFHPMVVRAMAGDNGNGFSIKAGKRQQFSWSFDASAIQRALKSYLDDYERRILAPEVSIDETRPGLDAGRLSVVIFIQDDKTRKILQSAYLEPSKAGPAK